MKTQIASLILLISTAFIAKAQGYNNYDLNIGEFSELRVLDGINVDYTCATDSAGRVFFDCQPDLASAFIFFKQRRQTYNTVVRRKNRDKESAQIKGVL